MGLTVTQYISLCCSLLYEYYLGKEDAAYLQVVKALEVSSEEGSVSGPVA